MLIHIQLIVNNDWIADVVATPDTSKGLMMLLAIFSLLYPVFGWIAEVCVGKYNMILVSFVTILVASVATSVGIIILLIGGTDGKYPVVAVNDVFLLLLVFISIAGIAMYETNAIQFSMDQMLEESSQQLSSFILLVLLVH